jgi:hypothetical protein
VLVSNLGGCLDQELPGTGLESGPMGGGGQAETGPGPPGKSGISVET